MSVTPLLSMVSELRVYSGTDAKTPGLGAKARTSTSRSRSTLSTLVVSAPNPATAGISAQSVAAAGSTRFMKDSTINLCRSSTAFVKTYAKAGLRTYFFCRRLPGLLWRSPVAVAASAPSVAPDEKYRSGTVDGILTRVPSCPEHALRPWRCKNIHFF